MQIYGYIEQNILFAKKYLEPMRHAVSVSRVHVDLDGCSPLTMPMSHTLRWFIIHSMQLNIFAWLKLFVNFANNQPGTVERTRNWGHDFSDAEMKKKIQHLPCSIQLVKTICSQKTHECGLFLAVNLVVCNFRLDLTWLQWSCVAINLPGEL